MSFGETLATNIWLTVEGSRSGRRVDVLVTESQRSRIQFLSHVGWEESRIHFLSIIYFIYLIYHEFLSFCMCASVYVHACTCRHARGAHMGGRGTACRTMVDGDWTQVIRFAGKCLSSWADLLALKVWLSVRSLSCHLARCGDIVKVCSVGGDRCSGEFSLVHVGFEPSVGRPREEMQ